MDCNFAWVYYSLINELTQGMEYTKQLRTYLSSVAFTSTSESTPELLLQKVLSSYEQSLLILKWSGSAPQSLQPLPPTGSAIEPAVSTDRSPTVDDKKRSFKDQTELIYISKRRKSWPTWTEQVKVSVENRFERPTDDGYCWRKYGQKDLPEAKHPRGYYRCTYRYWQNCWAIKTMQKSNYDPLVFEIVYKGRHTCKLATNSALQAASPEKEAPSSALQAASPEKEAPSSALQAASPEKEAPNSALQAASPEKEAPNSALQAASPGKMLLILHYKQHHQRKMLLILHYKQHHQRKKFLILLV
ncbi:probable WRKY transcription factor 53 [Lycium ferocissimum]|uniref:probable WRKY transcription factor 53 n=1 Tax=Lycium ferocissimum TaxID=112874 RepID=UPI0028157987|nr:probable WRKY transcription factor 53 [Lycium ferocissimum]